MFRWFLSILQVICIIECLYNIESVNMFLPIFRKILSISATCIIEPWKIFLELAQCIKNTIITLSILWECISPKYMPELDNNEINHVLISSQRNTEKWNEGNASNVKEPKQPLLRTWHTNVFQRIIFFFFSYLKNTGWPSIPITRRRSPSAVSFSSELSDTKNRNYFNWPRY